MSDFSNKKILIVDDDPIFLEIIEKKLKKEGINLIKKISSPSQTIEEISKEKYDLILLDVMLPELDGISLFFEITKLSPNSKVIFVTNYGESIVQQNSFINKEIAENLGAADYFNKKNDLNILIEMIKKFLIE
jgi:CheY-like chemotaxis protein